MSENSHTRLLLFVLSTSILYFGALQVWRLYFMFCNVVPLKSETFTHGWRLDVSMISGVLLASFLSILFLSLLKIQQTQRLWKIFHTLMWCFISVTEFTSALLYSEWGSTLDARAVSYMTHPKEVWASVNGYLSVFPIMMAGIVFMGGLASIHASGKRMIPVFLDSKKSYFLVFMIMLLTILGLRGGLQKLPVTPADAFKSDNMKENFASVNKVWYFIYSLLHQQDLRTSSDDEAIETFRQRYTAEKQALAEATPDWRGKNIVLLVLEGWSADMVSYLGGNEKVTPFFDSIAQHSISFNRMYAAGFRTDQGILALLSGIPSIGGENLLNNTSVVSQFPSLPAILHKAGYQTSFFYGGDMNFANMDFYIRSLGFDAMQGGADFSENVKDTEWGAPDHVVADKAFESMQKSETPFFTTVLFLSSHAPFEIPWENRFTKSNDIPSRYKGSVHYSDQSLRHFFKRIDTTTWRDNTVFIITSDHGSTHSGRIGLEDPARFQIPAIVYEPGNNTDKNRIIGTTANQSDLPSSIAAALGLEQPGFPFSRNVFDADTSRIACWSTDVYAACTHNLQPVSNHQKHYSEQAVLFQDMIRKWIQAL